MELERLVADVEPDVGGEALGHGAGHGGVGGAGVEFGGGVTHHEPGRLEIGRHVGEAEAQGLEFGQGAAELAACLDMLKRRMEAGAGAAQGGRRRC